MRLFKSNDEVVKAAKSIVESYNSGSATREECLRAILELQEDIETGLEGAEISSHLISLFKRQFKAGIGEPRELSATVNAILESATDPLSTKEKRKTEFDMWLAKQPARYKKRGRPKRLMLPSKEVKKIVKVSNQNGFKKMPLAETALDDAFDDVSKRLNAWGIDMDPDDVRKANYSPKPKRFKKRP